MARRRSSRVYRRTGHRSKKLPSGSPVKIRSPQVESSEARIQLVWALPTCRSPVTGWNAADKPSALPFSGGFIFQLRR